MGCADPLSRGLPAWPPTWRWSAWAQAEMEEWTGVKRPSAAPDVESGLRDVVAMFTDTAADG